MPRQLVTRLELAELLNAEIKRRLGDAEGCSVAARQIGPQAVDSQGCNWRVSGWFRSSRPSGDDCEAIVKAASEKLQKIFNLKPELP